MYRPNRLRSSNEGWLVSYADLITNLLIFFVLIISASEMQQGKMEKIIESISKTAPTESLSSAAKDVQKALKEQEIADKANVQLTDAGLEISFESGVTFASGSAEILADMQGPLTKVLAVVKPYTDKYSIAVEGHTDETPIHAGHMYKSNWELSAARALRIRERLEAVGVPPKKVRIEGYADTKPIKPEAGKGLDRQALLAKHRRVVLRLY